MSSGQERERRACKARITNRNAGLERGHELPSKKVQVVGQNGGQSDLPRDQWSHRESWQLFRDLKNSS